MKLLFLGSRRGGTALLSLLAVALFATQAAAVSNMASTTTTITHTRTKVTTETTTDIGGTSGSRGFLFLLVIVVAAASVAVAGGYAWGKRRARKAMLGASN